jgi:hypothetical protein
MPHDPIQVNVNEILRRDNGPNALRDILAYSRRHLGFLDWWFLLFKLARFPAEAWRGVDLDHEMAGVPVECRQYASIVRILSCFEPLGEADLQILRTFLIASTERGPLGLNRSVIGALVERGALQAPRLFPDMLIVALVEEGKVGVLEQVLSALVGLPGYSISESVLFLTRNFHTARLEFLVKLSDFLVAGPTAELSALLKEEYVRWNNFDDSSHQVLCADLAWMCRQRSAALAIRLALEVGLALGDARDFELLVFIT